MKKNTITLQTEHAVSFTIHLGGFYSRAENIDNLKNSKILKHSRFISSVVCSKACANLITAMGRQQFLPLSVVQLKRNHFWRLTVVMEVAHAFQKSLVQPMDYVRHGEIQGHSLVFFKAFAFVLYHF